MDGKAIRMDNFDYSYIIFSGERGIGFAGPQGGLSPGIKNALAFSEGTVVPRLAERKGPHFEHLRPILTFFDDLKCK
jgi:hypothetical protein